MSRPSPTSLSLKQCPMWLSTPMPSTVTVTILVRDARLVIEVMDDGVGGADPEKGSGLRGLADRVEALDGTVEIDSQAGSGTRLAAEIPLDGPPRPDQLTLTHL